MTNPRDDGEADDIAKQEAESVADAKRRLAKRSGTNPRDDGEAVGDSELCADCGKPIGMNEPSYYRKAPDDDIGRSYHSTCGDPFGTKQLHEQIATLSRQIAEAQAERDALMQDGRWAVNVLLETIAAKFDAHDTYDIWKSDAASTVRSFKHDLASPTPPAPVVTEEMAIITGCNAWFEARLRRGLDTELRKCSYPSCTCTQTPTAIKAALSRQLAEAQGVIERLIEQCAQTAEAWHPMLYAPEHGGSHPTDSAYRSAREGIARAIRALSAAYRTAEKP